MDFQEVVVKRRTIRDFSNRPIDKQIVYAALHAGIHDGAVLKISY